jgi:hypothetical protein
MNNILYLKTFTYYEKRSSIERLILLDKNNEVLYFFNYDFYTATYSNLELKIMLTCKPIEKILTKNHLMIHVYQEYDKYYIDDLQKEIILNMTRKEILLSNLNELFLKIGSIEYII